MVVAAPDDELGGRGYLRRALQQSDGALGERFVFFDAEARLETRIANGRYRVEIEIPYRRT